MNSLNKQWETQPNMMEMSTFRWLWIFQSILWRLLYNQITIEITFDISDLHQKEKQYNYIQLH